MITINYNENWNGHLLADTFLFIRPFSQDFGIGEEVQICLKGDLLGYGKITNGYQCTFGSLNETTAQLLMGKPEPYFKKVLASMFGYSIQTINPNFPVYLGVIKYINRHMPTQSAEFEKFYRKAAENSAAVQGNIFSQINHYND